MPRRLLVVARENIDLKIALLEVRHNCSSFGADRGVEFDGTYQHLVTRNQHERVALVVADGLDFAERSGQAHLLQSHKALTADP